MIKTSGYQTQSIDTSIEAELIQFSLWRKLTLLEKAELVSSWTKGCWQLGLNAICDRYSNASQQKIRKEFARLTLEKEIYDWILQYKLDLPLMLTDPISLALVVAEIFENLKIPYLVGGSLASSLLGEPRSTQDIDFVADLNLDNIENLIQALQPRFYVSEDAIKEAIASQQSFNIIDNESLGKVDIFILKNQPFNRSEFQRKRARIVRQNPERLLILPTPEDIILQKLIWHRLGFSSQKQWRDILGVIKLQGEQLDFAYLRQWANTLELLESLNRALIESGFPN